MSDLLTRRTAVVSGPCRYTLSRQWDDLLPMAAWLLCNPSVADADLDDPTCKRMTHFSRKLGCGGFTAVNVWPLRTTYPADLWRMLAAGDHTEAMRETNDLAINLARSRSEVLVAAFGVEPVRRDRRAVERALDIFTDARRLPMLCLGTNDDGLPLHPLARGKFAIPNDRELRPWSRPS